MAEIELLKYVLDWGLLILSQISLCSVTVHKSRRKSRSELGVGHKIQISVVQETFSDAEIGRRFVGGC